MTGRIDAVIFDWGGTLSLWAEVDLEDLWRLAAQHLAGEHSQAQHPARGDAGDLTRRLVAAERRFWERVEATQRSATLADLLAEVSLELRLDVTDAVLAEAATRHLDGWTPHIEHDPDCGRVLAELRAHGYVLGLLSNTLWPRAFHDRFLERDGLLPYLTVRCYTSEMTHTKPHPEAFRTVLDALGVAAGRAVFVGDRPFDDIMGAQRAGMRTVLRPNAAIDARPSDVRPDAVIESLTDLPAIVARMSRGQEDTLAR